MYTIQALWTMARDTSHHHDHLHNRPTHPHMELARVGATSEGARRCSTLSGPVCRSPRSPGHGVDRRRHVTAEDFDVL